MSHTLTTMGLVALSLVCSSTQSDNAQRLIESASAYKQMVTIANAWKAAVQGKNVDRLVEFTWPEDRDLARRELQNQKSSIYRILVSPGGPLQRLLARRKTRLLMFEERMGAFPVTNYALCLDAAPTATALNLSFDSITEIRRDDVFCTRWVSGSDGTFVSYTFALPE